MWSLLKKLHEIKKKYPITGDFGKSVIESPKHFAILYSGLGTYFYLFILTGIFL